MVGMSRRWMAMAAVLVMLALLLAACGGGTTDTDDGDLPGDEPVEEPNGDDDIGQEPADDEQQDDDGDATARPATKAGTIMIEGMPEPMDFILFEVPDDWPLAFSTYHTADFLAEPLRTGEGDAVNFVANFGGTRNDEVLIQVFFHPEGTDPGEADMVAEHLAQDFQLEPADDDDDRAPWAYAVWVARGGPNITWLAAAEYDGQYFYLLADYPAEYGDGIGPRIGVILREWIWTDTGAPLMGDS